MYTTHGDMIIFRPNHRDRMRAVRHRDGWADPPRESGSGSSAGRRLDLPREGRAGQPREDRPAPSDSLRERIAELEARVSRLEAQLERVGERPARREAVPELMDERRRPRERLYEPDGGAERGPSRRARRGAQQTAESPQVRVSLHADGGAQVSLGEVRMISQD